MTIDKKRTEKKKKSLLLETIADKKTYFSTHTHMAFTVIIHLHPPLWQKKEHLKGGHYECSISLSHYKHVRFQMGTKNSNQKNVKTEKGCLNPH